MKLKSFASVMIAGLALSTTAMAADSGTLLLEGVVADNTSIQVNAEGTANRSINILGGENQKLVGKAVEQSNNLNGYKILMKSDKGGKLVHTTDATKSTTYQVSYNDASAVSLTTTNQQVKEVTSLSGLTSYTSNIKVNVTAYANAPSGTYQDTVTVTIQAR